MATAPKPKTTAAKAPAKADAAPTSEAAEVAVETVEVAVETATVSASSVASVVAPAAEIVAAAEAVAAEAAKQIEQAAAASKEAIETAVKASKEAAHKGYDKAASLTKEQFVVAAKVQTDTFKSVDDAFGSSQAYVDAVSKAAQIFSKGAQDLGRAVLALTQDVIEAQVAAGKQLLGAKTLVELIDVQTSLTKVQLDRLVRDGVNLSDLAVKLVEESAAPLNAQVNQTVDNLIKRAA